MLYPINIYVFQNGNKLDVSQEETIEINMGGISLLNLQQRTYTHTNSFSLPRTPNNEAELGYIGLKQVYANPRIEVIIQRGSINLRGFITVLNTTESTIEVSFAYDDGGGFADLKNMNFYELVYNETYPEFDNNANGKVALMEYIITLNTGVGEKLYYAPHCSGGQISSYDRINSGGLLIRFIKLIEMLELELGITINGKTNIPARLWVINKGAHFGVALKSGGTKIQPFVSTRSDMAGKFFSISDVLRAFCQYHFLDFVQTSYNTFEFRTFNYYLTQEPYVIEQDILEWGKRTTTGLKAVNEITYKNNGRWFADIRGNGEGRGELFKSLVSAPTRPFLGNEPLQIEMRGYDFENCDDVIFITQNQITGYDRQFEFDTFNYYDINSFFYLELSVPPSLNNTIGTALVTPIIFDITIWLSNYDFEQVSQKRMVRSVVLGGDFFVEKMAYNVNTGNAVLTLIKKW